MSKKAAAHASKVEYYESPVRAKPRPLISARDLRAKLKAVYMGEEARVLGDRARCKLILIPVPRYEWTKAMGMDKRMKETRRRFEDVMAILER